MGMLNVNSLLVGRVSEDHGLRIRRHRSTLARLASAIVVGLNFALALALTSTNGPARAAAATNSLTGQAPADSPPASTPKDAIPRPPQVPDTGAPAPSDAQTKTSTPADPAKDPDA